VHRINFSANLLQKLQTMSKLVLSIISHFIQKMLLLTASIATAGMSQN
jgi:hypothetical protein